MDVVEISLVWALGCAAVAAAANTLVAGKFRFLPSIEVRSPGTSPLLVFGLVGNVAIAAAAAFLAWMTVGGYGRGPLDETGTVLSSLAYVGIGFVGSRWATTEYDKVVLSSCGERWA